MTSNASLITLPPLPLALNSPLIAGHAQAYARAAVEADREHIADVRNMVPSDEELDDLSDEFHGYSGNHTRDGYLIPKFDYLGFARALLSKYGNRHE